MNTAKNLSKIKNPIPNEEKPLHIPSKVQADTLFTFMEQFDFLATIIKNKMISPRYCDENIEYLEIDGIEKIAIPMKCFCDINMHKLNEHLDWYGYYGLAFSKEWGMNKGIQPIQYINPKSALCKDFSQAFNSALKIKAKKQSIAQKQIKSFMVHEIMYYKPYSGKMENRNTKEVVDKCFTDESEWRFIPDVSSLGFSQLYYGEQIFNAGILNDMSNSLSGKKEVSLTFNYEDIKYIVVKNAEDFKKLSLLINEMKLNKQEEREIFSKVIVWEISKGDF